MKSQGFTTSILLYLKSSELRSTRQSLLQPCFSLVILLALVWSSSVQAQSLTTALDPEKPRITFQPGRNEIRFAVEGDVKEWSLLIFNSAGKEVFSSSLSQERQLTWKFQDQKAQTLPPGDYAYLATLKDSAGKTYMYGRSIASQGNNSQKSSAFIAKDSNGLAVESNIAGSVPASPVNDRPGPAFNNPGRYPETDYVKTVDDKKVKNPSYPGEVEQHNNTPSFPSGGYYNVNLGNNTQNQSQSAETTIPAVPTRRSDRFGVAHSDTDEAAFLGHGSDRLNWGADEIAKAGSHTIRVYLGPEDIYQVNPSGPFDLEKTAASPAYDKLFRDARFQTYLLTVYSSADSRNIWTQGYSPTDYRAESDEIKRLGNYLLSNPHYARKTFIILNREGDNALKSVASNAQVWENYTNWIQSRVNGVKEARLLNPLTTAHLYSGLEFNLVRKNNGDCGARAANPLDHRCVIDYVAPKVEVDYYSYSLGQSIETVISDSGATLKGQINADLGFALATIKAKRSRITEANFIIGEYGFSRQHFSECKAANYLGEVFDALEESGGFKASYAVFSQTADNQPSTQSVTGFFSLYEAHSSQFNLLGETFQRWLANQSVAYRVCQ